MNFIEKYYPDIFEFITAYDLKNKTNTEAYETYLDFCKEKSHKTITSKIAFSRYIVKFSDYKIINKTINNKKYRIFVKKNE